MDNRNHAATQGKPKPLLVYIVAAYAAALIIANVLAGNMLQVWRWETSAGILTFPITYILASVLGEVYGYKWARRAAWVALALNALMAGLIALSILLPQPGWYDIGYFAGALGNTWRVVAGSLVAFTVGKWVNDNIFARMKGEKKDMRGFTMRAMGSSICGHVLDTTLFYTIALAGAVIPWEAIPGVIFISVLLKWGYEWLFLPLTLWVVKRVKIYEQSV